MKRMAMLLALLLLAMSTLIAHADVDKATVKQVQQKLNEAGYDCGTPDGVAGKKTHVAIENYRKNNGLDASNAIDDKLLQSLGLAEETNAPVEAVPQPEPSEIQPQSDIAYANPVDYDAPELPADAVAKLGGIPLSIYSLGQWYQYSDMRNEYSSAAEAMREVRDALVKDGSCIFPDILPTSSPMQAGIYSSDYNYNEISLQGSGSEVTACLSNQLTGPEPYRLYCWWELSNKISLTMEYRDDLEIMIVDDTYRISNDEYWRQEYGISGSVGRVVITHYGQSVQEWIAKYDENGDLTSIKYREY